MAASLTPLAGSRLTEIHSDQLNGNAMLTKMPSSSHRIGLTNRQISRMNHHFFGIKPIFAGELPLMAKNHHVAIAGKPISSRRLLYCRWLQRTSMDAEGNPSSPVDPTSLLTESAMSTKIQQVVMVVAVFHCQKPIKIGIPIVVVSEISLLSMKPRLVMT
ncbi:hypothetical protein ACLOJK_018650 [Asimina triloba]